MKKNDDRRWIRRLVRACLFALIRLLEWALLLHDGWRPCRIQGRGDGRLWFWKSKPRNQVLCREIAYELAAMDYRPKVRPLATANTKTPDANGNS